MHKTEYKTFKLEHTYYADCTHKIQKKNFFIDFYLINKNKPTRSVCFCIFINIINAKIAHKIGHALLYRTNIMFGNCANKWKTSSVFDALQNSDTIKHSGMFNIFISLICLYWQIYLLCLFYCILNSTNEPRLNTKKKRLKYNISSFIFFIPLSLSITFAFTRLYRFDFTTNT